MFHHRGDHGLGECRAHGGTASRGTLFQWCGHQTDTPGRRHRGGSEHEGHVPVTLVPAGHRGVTDKRSGVGGHQRPHGTGTERGQTADARKPTGHGGDGGDPGERTVPHEDPRTNTHRRARLEHPQHVDEPLGATQVVDEGTRGTEDRKEPGVLQWPGKCGPAREFSTRGDRRRCSGKSPEEEVAADGRPLPHDLIEDRLSVVGDEVTVLGLGGRGHALPSITLAPLVLTNGPGGARDRVPSGDLALDAFLRHIRRGHCRLPTNVAATPANRAAAATPACRHIDGRSRVVTTGSGGSPYTSGSSSRRKNAPLPPTPSSGSSP